MENLAKLISNEQLGYVKPKFETKVTSCPFRRRQLNTRFLEVFLFVAQTWKLYIVCRVSKLKW